jgi:hypothetical protein
MLLSDPSFCVLEREVRSTAGAILGSKVISLQRLDFDFVMTDGAVDEPNCHVFNPPSVEGVLCL